ncbi:MAG: hypothetical protein ACP5VS_14290 [Desulfomonilaceae bacterium]
MKIIGKIGKCLNCGAKYKKNIRTQEFCSEKCKNEFFIKQKRQTLVCPVCGESFTTTRQNKIYCSRLCQLNRASEKPQHATKRVVTAKCVICGKLLGRTNQKVCSSPECVKEHRKQTHKYRYKGYRPKKPSSFKLTPENRARLKEIREINELRESMDLRPISAGVIKCRMCEQDFFSEDITRVKTCETCKESANEIESDYISEGGAKQNKQWII